MFDVKEVVFTLVTELQNQPYQDISDVGNIVGLVLGKYIKDDTEEENNIRSFKFGLDHGIELNFKQQT